MDYYYLITSILLIHILRWLIPGPVVALLMRNSLVYSRKTGFWTALGFALSSFAHILLAVTGIALIIASSTTAQSFIKFIGSGYLLYLGYNTSFKKTQQLTIAKQAKHHDISPVSAVKIGFITNFFNPNTPLFAMSIFGSLIASNSPAWVIIFLMLAMPINNIIMASLWSVFFSHQSIKGIYTRYQPILNKCIGGALIILALKMAFF